MKQMFVQQPHQTGKHDSTTNTPLQIDQQRVREHQALLPPEIGVSSGRLMPACVAIAQSTVMNSPPLASTFSCAPTLSSLLDAAM